MERRNCDIRCGDRRRDNDIRCLPRKEDQIRKTRAMILDEIEPIISELSLLHSEIDGLKNAGVNEISTIKHDSDISHQ